MLLPIIRFFQFIGSDGLVGLRRVFAESLTINQIVDVCSFKGLQQQQQQQQQQNEQKDLNELGLIVVLDSGQVCFQYSQDLNIGHSNYGTIQILGY